MDRLEITAPAKINLNLEVVRRREDGFHDIKTRMLPLEFGDKVVLERTTDPGIVLRCSDPDLPTDRGNLAYAAAADYLAARSDSPDGGLGIELEKHIPAGAGLGGGSSDAAAVLLGLDRIFPDPLGRDRLVGIAANLGSDIPFFLYQSACDCRGRGEIVEPLPWPHALDLLLLKPGFSVATPWAYQQWKSARPIPGIDYDPQSLPEGIGPLFNDLEIPVFEKYPYLADLKTWLRDQPEFAAALMSGSGSTVFAIWNDGVGAPSRESLMVKIRARFGRDLWLCPTRAYSESTS